MINQRLEELVTMTEYVGRLVEGSDTAYTQIKNYYELLTLPLNWEMFTGSKPLFPGFKEQIRHLLVSEDGIVDIMLYNQPKEATDIDMYYKPLCNLKTVEDLCGKGIEYDDEIRQFWVDEMRDTKKCRGSR